MVEDIVIISELVGLQVDTGGCEKLMEEYSELSAEELQKQHQRMNAKELSEEEGEYQQSVPQYSLEIKKILKTWTEL